MPTHIVIPDERAEQLRRFAEANNTTLAGAVTLLIQDAIAAGKIADTVPGFTIERSGDTVKIEAAGAFAKEMNRETARAYAEQIRSAIRPLITPGAGNPLMPENPFRGLIEVARRGTGVKLRDPETKAEKTIAPSVAEDVARLVDKAASDDAL